MSTWSNQTQLFLKNIACRFRFFIPIIGSVEMPLFLSMYYFLLKWNDYNYGGNMFTIHIIIILQPKQAKTIHTYMLHIRIAPTSRTVARRKLNVETTSLLVADMQAGVKHQITTSTIWIQGHSIVYNKYIRKMKNRSSFQFCRVNQIQ